RRSPRVRRPNTAAARPAPIPRAKTLALLRVAIGPRILPSPMRSTDELSAWVRDARRRTLELVAGLDERRLMGPRLAIVNPLLWEIGHVAWFQEHWVLRHAAGQASARADADALWDSSAVAHDTRWALPLPALEQTLGYMRDVEARVLRVLDDAPSPAVRYHAEYTVYHEDMHDEAFAYTRQTLGYPPPS